MTSRLNAARGLLAALRPLLVIATVAMVVPGARAFAAGGPSIATLRATGAAEIQDIFVRVPQGDAVGDPPYQVLIALHGRGGNGADFGERMADEADAHGWLIVAPTIGYGDWTDPVQIAREDPALIAWLAEFVRQLPAHLGMPVAPRVLLFGHSRGAQLALRFTELNPELVAGVAAVAAGTYTLPFARDAGTGRALQFPYGIADLAEAYGGRTFNARRFGAVPVWIGVGGADTNEKDVPDEWDPYIGRDRLHRARAFT
jgi:pimeloyl-ACP methyl ester carboxylesterase